MKILSSKQLREADKLTIDKQGISSTELMERAASKVFDEIHKRLEGADIPVKVFCGIGNNGGDGLVVSRLLIEQGYSVTVYVVNYSDQRSDDFLINYDRVKNMTRKWPVLIKSAEDFPQINPGDFVIDAIFGVGLNRPATGWVADLISHINKSGAFVLAIDMPSGLMADSHTEGKAILLANYTITFQTPKMSFFLPATAPYVGELHVMDIGLDKEYLEQAKGLALLIGKNQARALYRPRSKFSHKGTYGHALLVGGSYGKIGSVCLAATSALRTGAGMVTVFLPSCGYEILQTTLPEAMVLTDKNRNKITHIEYEINPTVIGIGTGLGTAGETVEGMRDLLEKTTSPMVIDADGLNILAKHRDLLEHVPESSILTPHPKELERLIGSWSDDFEKIKKARQFSEKYKIILVLKDAYTLILTPEDLYVNTSGNPGMATAGSGDVLTGMLTAMCSQGYAPLEAAVLGTYLHGSAGDIAAKNHSYEGMIAGDIASYAGSAILDLFKKNPDH